MTRTISTCTGEARITGTPAEVETYVAKYAYTEFNECQDCFSCLGEILAVAGATLLGLVIVDKAAVGFKRSLCNGGGKNGSS